MHKNYTLPFWHQPRSYDRTHTRLDKVHADKHSMSSHLATSPRSSTTSRRPAVAGSPVPPLARLRWWSGRWSWCSHTAAARSARPRCQVRRPSCACTGRDWVPRAAALWRARTRRERHPPPPAHPPCPTHAGLDTPPPAPQGHSQILVGSRKYRIDASAGRGVRPGGWRHQRRRIPGCRARGDWRRWRPAVCLLPVPQTRRPHSVQDATRASVCNSTPARRPCQRLQRHRSCVPPARGQGAAEDAICWSTPALRWL